MTAPGPTRGRAGVVGEVVDVLPAWLAARALTALAWAVVQAADPVPDRGSVDQVAPGLLAWDGGWYRAIAEHGYDAVGLTGTRFFPLYPALGRLLAPLFGGRDAWALVVVANVAALAALVLLARLVRSIGGDRTDARFAVWAVSLYPASFVLVWAYSEPLMLVGVLGAVLAARQGRWWWAAAAAAVAGASRPLGVLVALALVIELAGEWTGRSVAARRDAAAVSARVSAVLAAPAAAAAYVVWASARFDQWPAPVRAQDDLRGDLVLPPVRLVQALGEVVTDPLGDGAHAPFAWGLVILAIVAFRGARRLSTVVVPWSLAVYSAVAVAVAVGAENLNSLERYGLNAVPLLVLAAGIVRRAGRRHRWVPPAAAAASGAALVAVTALAWAGEYVP